MAAVKNNQEKPNKEVIGAESQAQNRFSTIRMMDRILVMHQGRFVEQGSHEELMAAAGHYKELYSMHDHYRAGGSP